MMDTGKRNVVFSVNDLSLKIEGREVLRSLNLELYKGQSTGLVGLSGAGKTVLSRALLGLIPTTFKITSGTCTCPAESGIFQTLSMKDEKYGTAIRGGVAGYIVQNAGTALNPSVRCGLQVVEVLRHEKSIPPEEKHRRVIELLLELDFEDPERIYQSFPHELSGGQKQRIVIAMSVIGNPLVVIADEPTTGLDAITEQSLLSLLKDVTTKRNIALLLISHDVGVLKSMTDTLLVLNAGTIVVSGPTNKLLKETPHPVLENIMTAYREAKLTASRQGEIELKLPILQAKNISRTYYGKSASILANKNITLDIRPGEFIALIGVSGSGKSTLGLILSGLLEQDSGVIASGNVTVKNKGREEGARLVQMIFQDPYASLYPHKSLGYMLREGILQETPGMEKSAISKRQEILMRKVGLSGEYLERYAHQLSGGERQRFQIARALAVSPAVLICDESLEGLDLPIQLKIMEILNTLRKEEGLALVFITHHLGMARRFADRMVILHYGEIIEEGPVEKIFTRPDSMFTKSLVEAEKQKQIAF